MPIRLTDEDAPIVGSICRKLGGVALAIELTAGRVEAYGIRRTAELLDSQFSLLWPGRRTAPPRHQTLNATLDWSYNLLSDLERLVLRRLSVFVGGFTLDVAQKVVGTPDLEEAKVHNAIVALVAKSLASTDMSGPVPRCRLLDTTRTYASTKLSDTGESELLRRRHALCYRDILENAADQATVDQDQAGIAAADVDNIRAALNWAFGPGGDPSVGVDLAAYSASLWYGKALLTEYRHWANVAAAAVAADSGAPPNAKTALDTDGARKHRAVHERCIGSGQGVRGQGPGAGDQPQRYKGESIRIFGALGTGGADGSVIKRHSTLRKDVPTPPGRVPSPD